MPNATLGTNLVDSLIASVVDPLRSSLYPAMGVRQYNVRLIKRQWSDGVIGGGTASVTQDQLLDPQPQVIFSGQEDRLSPDAGCGRVDQGRARLFEVSLTYTEAELYPDQGPGEEFYYQIEDAQGQAIKTTYWIPTNNPVPDREKTLGWIVDLRLYERA